MQVQCNSPSQQGPSAGHASTAYAAAKFETLFYYNKCTVQVQCNSPFHPSAGHASTAYAAAKFETQSSSALEKALCR